MSDVSRERMRRAKLGKPRSPNNKGRTGQTHPHTEETKRKISRAMLGENNHNWQGGVNTLNHRIRQLAQYKTWRYNVYYRDDWTCQKCNKRGCRLEPHHIISLSSIIKNQKITSIEEAINCIEIWNVDNGLTLCLSCHIETDGFRNRGQ